jgi:hypothetical protein
VTDRLFGVPEGGAEFSDDGLYRYTLWRGDLPRLGWLMLNPSTADAEQDDPTIRRCRNLAEREGYAGIQVRNMFAWRATKPEDLTAPEDIFGPENLQALQDMFEHCDQVVCAWGAHYPAVLRRRERAGRREDTGSQCPMIAGMGDRYGTKLVCVGRSKDGHPRHPLMVKTDVAFEPWRPIEGVRGG